MVVNLKRDFFGPDGTLYRSVDNPHTFPKDWKVPKDAEELPEPEKKVPVKPAEK